MAKKSLLPKFEGAKYRIKFTKRWWGRKWGTPKLRNRSQIASQETQPDNGRLWYPMTVGATPVIDLPYSFYLYPVRALSRTPPVKKKKRTKNSRRNDAVILHPICEHPRADVYSARFLLARHRHTIRRPCNCHVRAGGGLRVVCTTLPKCDVSALSRSIYMWNASPVASVRPAWHASSPSCAGLLRRAKWPAFALSDKLRNGNLKKTGIPASPPPPRSFVEHCLLVPAYLYALEITTTLRNRE